MEELPILCPSARCEDGAMLLGIVQSDGRVAFLGGELSVDEEFVERANRGRAPEKRFRFGNTCVECACQQWTGSRCGVIDHVLDMATEDDVAESLPRCGIRPRCRWFRQSGPQACAVCDLVVTDATD